MKMPPSRPQNQARSEPLIGGFFALEPEGPGGMAAHWGMDHALAWENASSALAALVRHLRPPAVWMPGYLCAHMAAAVPAPMRRFFSVDADLAPDLASLNALQSGDLVLAVSYFGRDPGPLWRDFASRRPDVTFVEDGAQMLDSGQSAWSDWRLFSPRKLFGVPEGGILVALTDRARKSGLPGPHLPADPAAVAQRRLPMQMRRDAPANNTLWHPAHQAAEASGQISDRAMDRAALDLLCSLDPAPMIAARKANFARLSALLADHALIDDPNPGFAPFGFPVRLPAPQRDSILRRIYAQGVFPAVHWRDIAAPPNQPADHARAANLATLPCDHRYGPQDMARVASVFQESLN